MQSTPPPVSIPVPFADTGVKNSIPTESQIGVTAGKASLTDGFPPLTFTPIADGGVPPAGADFNGVLNMLAQTARWAQAGGPWLYDSTFSAAIGGYPKGAMLFKADSTGFWFSTIENNTTNPDTGGGGWTHIPTITELAGLPDHSPVRLVTGAYTGGNFVPAALPAYTYNNGSAGVGATWTFTATGVVSLDGKALALNDRVLILGEADPTRNGFAIVTTAPAVGVQGVLTRTTDGDTPAELGFASTVVTDGNTLTNWGFRVIQSAAQIVAIGTSAINFVPTGTGGGVGVEAVARAAADAALQVQITANALAAAKKTDFDAFTAAQSSYPIAAGLPVVGTGTGAGAATYVYATPFATTKQVRRLRIFGGSVGGAAIVRRFTRAGTTNTQIGVDYPITVTPGVANSISVDITFQAGELFGIYAPLNCFTYIIATAIDAGYYATASNSTSFVAATPTTTNQLQIGLDEMIQEVTSAVVNGLSDAQSSYLLAAGLAVVVAGTSAGMSTYVNATPFAATTRIRRARIFGGSAGGSAVFRRFTRSGTTNTQVGVDYPVTVTPGVENALTLDITFQAGEYWGLFAPTSCFTFISGLANDAGYYNTASNSTSFSQTTPVASNRLQIGLDTHPLTAMSTVLAAQASNSRATNSVMGTVDVRGTPILVAAGSNAAANTYVYPLAVPYDRRLKRVRVFGGTVGGNMRIAPWTKGSTTYTRAAVPIDVTIAPNAANDITVDMLIPAGSCIGYFAAVTGVFAYKANVLDAEGVYGTGGATEVASITIPALLTIHTMQVAFEFEGNGDTAALAEIGGKRVPTLLIVDGNSIDQGGNGLFVPWATPFQQATQMKLVNKAVAGQTTQQMTANGVANIDPYAVVTGYRSVLICHELFNDIQFNGITINQAVDNLQTYCLARRAAGFIVGVCNIYDTADHGSFTNSMVGPLNALMLSRWFNFADFYIDLMAAPELRDHTNLTYFQPDGIHPTNLGGVAFKRVALQSFRMWALGQ